MVSRGCDLIVSAEKNRVCRRRMSWGSLAEPLLTANTTAILSQRQLILCPAQKGPQTATEMMIGTSSSGAIEAGRKEIPFHDFKNVCHHVMSARALGLRWTWWSRAFAVV